MRPVSVLSLIKRKYIQVIISVKKTRQGVTKRREEKKKKERLNRRADRKGKKAGLHGM